MPAWIENGPKVVWFSSITCWKGLLGNVSDKFIRQRKVSVIGFLCEDTPKMKINNNEEQRNYKRKSNKSPQQRQTTSLLQIDTLVFNLFQNFVNTLMRVHRL